MTAERRVQCDTKNSSSKLIVRSCCSSPGQRPFDLMCEPANRTNRDVTAAQQLETVCPTGHGGHPPRDASPCDRPVFRIQAAPIASSGVVVSSNHHGDPQHQDPPVYVTTPLRILAIDVAAGTQDVLTYEDNREWENCPELVLPSDTQVRGRRMRTTTAERRPVHLTGALMGGGASSDAMTAHPLAGLPLSATPSAARTLHNDLVRVGVDGSCSAGRRPSRCGRGGNEGRGPGCLGGQHWRRSTSNCLG